MKRKIWGIKYYFSRLFKMNFKAWFKTIEEIHSRTGQNRIWLFFDMIFSSIRFGTGYVDYAEFEFYLLDNKERETYITTRISDKINLKYNDRNFIHYIEDKGIFSRKYKRYLGREVLDLRKNTLDDFKEFLKRHDRFMVKDYAKMGGEGIDYYLTKEIDDVELLYEDLLNKNQIIVEEFVTQHPEMSRLSKKSVNTIRMITFLDDCHEARLLVSALKAGTDSIIDNVGRGGIYTILDDEGIVRYPMIDQYFNRYEVHPLTKEKILGFEVPYFNEAIELVKEAALVTPELRYVGWDVAIGESGPVLIEGNTNTGPFQLIPSFSKEHIGILPKYKKYMEVD